MLMGPVWTLVVNIIIVSHIVKVNIFEVGVRTMMGSDLFMLEPKHLGKNVVSQLSENSTVYNCFKYTKI